MSARKGGLGKGLDALFLDNITDDHQESVSVLRISQIEPNRNQPRKEFDTEALTELAESIRQHGILQPLLVRPIGDDIYQIIAGERRWRAARMAGLREVPVVIAEKSDWEAIELALIENLQREDLNPVEEAQSYRDLMENCGYSQEEVAQRVNKSRPYVANALRMLKLPEPVLELVKQNKLSAGHARTLLSFQDEQEIIETANLVVQKGISVRELEKMAKKSRSQTGKAPKTKSKSRDPFFDEVELALSSELGRRVKVYGNWDNGTIEIEFYTKEELADIAMRLANEK